MIFEKTMSFFAAILGYFVLEIICWQLNQGDFHQHQLIYIVGNSLIVLLLFYVITKGKIAGLRLPSWSDLGLVVLAFMALFLFDVVYTNVISFQSGAAREVHDTIVQGISLSFFIDVCFFGPIREEILTRGFLQKGVCNNSWLGLLLAATYFSVLHGPENIATFLYYGVMGMTLGWLHKKSDNLVLPILLHIAWNSMVMFFVLRH
ncbi:lysostaphin resistance A-like protein [Streptococcus sp. ZJ93]|uniref:CPBP family intramembrane glutamic endopeptidase n=1 Tax=Streptococcus handemini TaxID=3161188 RepID=UPI0034D6C798